MVVSPATAEDNGKNVYFDMTAHCGAAGATAALPSGGFVNYWYTAASAAKATSGTEVPFDDVAVDHANKANRAGLIFAAKPTTCKCGTSSIPSDNCAALASTDLNTKCMTTDDS